MSGFEAFRTAPPGIRTAPYAGEMDSPDSPTDGPVRGAAAAGRALGEANAAAVLAALGARRDATVAAIARAAGVSERRARDHLYRLAAGGLAERSGTRWSLTAAGAGRAGPAPSAADVAAALDLLPSEAHRALARLVLSAVVARRARAAEGVTGWPAFGLWGPPGTAKTTVGRVLARLLGLAEPEAVRVASDLDRAELLGRRVPDGRGGYRFAPAPALGRPLLCLDELDKVRGEARGDALRLLQGDSALVLEGGRVVVAATVLAAFNAGTDPRDVLPADRLRRMVHVSTAGVSEAACRRAARQLFDDGPLPLLDPEGLDVPAGVVGAELRAFFDEELPGLLVPAARALHPGHALSLVVPGRMALDRADPETAALAVGRDYLTCAATWGGVKPGAARQLGRTAAPTAAADEARSERAEAVELAQAKALGTRRLGVWRRTLGEARDDEAVTLRAGLAEVARQLKGARSLDEVAEVDTVAAGIIDAVRARAEEREALAQVSAVRQRPGSPAATTGRLAVLCALQRHGSREAPGPALERLGLVEADPLPTGRGRWRGTGPEVRGAYVFEGEGWAELAVAMILAQAIAAERSRAGNADSVSALSADRSRAAPERPALALIAGLGSERR